MFHVCELSSIKFAVSTNSVSYIIVHDHKPLIQFI